MKVWGLGSAELLGVPQLSAGWLVRSVSAGPAATVLHCLFSRPTMELAGDAEAGAKPKIAIVQKPRYKPVGKL